MPIDDLKKKQRFEWKNTTLSATLRSQKSAQIRANIEGSDTFLGARVVGIYYPLDWEVDLLALWRRNPSKCAFPKTGKGQTLMFYRVESLEEFELGPAGILEPSVESTRGVDFERNDLILVPGVAFDGSGGRIGSGHGYYDRYLRNLPDGVVKWGICFSKFLAKDKLAQTVSDVRMEAIVTEAGLLWVC